MLACYPFTCIWFPKYSGTFEILLSNDDLFANLSLIHLIFSLSHKHFTNYDSYFKHLCNNLRNPIMISLMVEWFWSDWNTTPYYFAITINLKLVQPNNPMQYHNFIQKMTWTMLNQSFLANKMSMVLHKIWTAIEMIIESEWMSRWKSFRMKKKAK